MQRDVAELMNARPHMRTSAIFTVSEQRAYSDGYYTALVTVLRVLDACIARYKLTSAMLRAERRGKARA